MKIVKYKYPLFGWGAVTVRVVRIRRCCYSSARPKNRVATYSDGVPADSPGLREYIGPGTETTQIVMICPACQNTCFYHYTATLMTTYPDLILTSIKTHTYRYDTIDIGSWHASEDVLDPTQA